LQERDAAEIEEIREREQEWWLKTRAMTAMTKMIRGARQMGRAARSKWSAG